MGDLFSYLFFFFYGGVSHIFLQCIGVVPDMTEERVAKIMETATRDVAAA